MSHLTYRLTHSEPAWFAFRDVFTIDDYEDDPIPICVANWGVR
jgi:hypothetical protein